MCNEVLVAQKPVKAAGHTEVKDAAVAATCTEDGLTEGSHCSVCNEALVAQKTVKALGHDFSIDVPAKAATCTEDGYTAYKKCNRCGEKDGYQEIEASGHDFEDKLTAGEETHWYACKNCDAKKGEEAHIPGSPVKEKEQAAQVGAAGSYEEVVYCTACGAEISRKTVETDPLPEPKPEQEEESDQTTEAENPSEEPQDSDDTGAISIYTRDDLENVAMPKDVSGDDDDVIIEKLAGCPDNIKGTAKQELASLKRNGYTIDSGFGGWSKSGKTASCTIKLSEEDVPEGSLIFVNGEAVTAKLKDGYYYFPVTLPAVVFVVHK